MKGRSMSEDQPAYLAADIVRGKILYFLTVNKFRVELFDGQQIDAVLADELLPEVAQWYAQGKLPQGTFISVKVRHRQPPALPVIIEAHPDALST